MNEKTVKLKRGPYKEKTKIQVAMRLDTDLWEWVKSQPQPRINVIESAIRLLKTVLELKI